MSVFRVNKDNNYITMSNYHLKDKRISLKAKGLLSQMLSLPDDWNYTINGLVSINKEEETSIKTTLKELQRFKYLIVTKQLPNETSSGRIEYIYDIFEKPKQEGEKQEVENLGVEFLGVENQGLYNINNKIIKNKRINNIFKKPTIEEIAKYCKTRNNNIDPNKFYEYYETNNWRDKDNKPIKNWKQKMITWEGRNVNKQEPLPDWFGKDIKSIPTTKEEQDKLKDIIDNF
jgi:hypothetical protein